MSSADRPAVGFVGAGRAGTALAVALADAGYPITAIYSRTSSRARQLAERTGATLCASAEDVARLSEVLFLTVPDGAVEDVAAQIATAGGFQAGSAVVHTSGTLTSEVLRDAAGRGALTGAFHPLQALAGASSVPYLKGSYIGIEGSPELAPVLTAMAEALGAVPLDITDKNRVPYHIAAVLASNYTLALLAAASQLMRDAGIAEEHALAALLPLARGSLGNLERAGATHGLTGPVIRGDASTIARHLRYLRRHYPELARAYSSLGLVALDLVGNSPHGEEIREELER